MLAFVRRVFAISESNSDRSNRNNQINGGVRNRWNFCRRKRQSALNRSVGSERRISVPHIGPVSLRELKCGPSDSLTVTEPPEEVSTPTPDSLYRPPSPALPLPRVSDNQPPHSHTALWRYVLCCFRHLSRTSDRTVSKDDHLDKVATVTGDSCSVCPSTNNSSHKQSSPLAHSHELNPSSKPNCDSSAPATILLINGGIDCGHQSSPPDCIPNRTHVSNRTKSHETNNHQHQSTNSYRIVPSELASVRLSPNNWNISISGSGAGGGRNSASTSPQILSASKLMQLQTNQISVSSKRLMKELRDLMRKQANNSSKDSLFTVELVNDSLYEWYIRIPEFDHESQIYQDMQQHNIACVQLHAIFPDSYPFDPPFVRVMSPYIERGYVMEGGAICLELLTKNGWTSAYTMEAVVVQLMASFVKGQATIKANKDFSKFFTKKSATNSFRHIVRIHDKHGWVETPLFEG